MANRTVKDASSIHGTNPQYLVEKIIRTRIYDSKYWKEECFALTAELLVDKAMALRYIGGVYGGNIKPSPFLCLTLKMLQIQPEKDIIIEFIKQDEYKYVRALGCFYLRLVHQSLDCYKYLGPLLNDYRKLRIMDRNGIFQLSYMDEYIDNLLREERFADVILPRTQKRWVHEGNNELEPRVSLLEEDLDDLESESDDEAMPSSPPPSPPHHRSERSRRGETPPARDKRRRSPSPDPHKRRRGEHTRHRDSGRGDRGGNDHYSNNYPPEAYHDYQHSHDYHHGGSGMGGGGGGNASTDYHHRRPHNHHHSSNGGGIQPMIENHHAGGREHHSSREDYHHSSREDYHHSSREDYHHSSREDHHQSSRDDHHGGRGEEHYSRSRKEHRSKGGEGRRGDDRDEGRREDRKKEGREGRRKEGRSGGRRGEGSNLQAEIDEANALRAQLGLPPLK